MSKEKFLFGEKENKEKETPKTGERLAFGKFFDLCFKNREIQSEFEEDFDDIIRETVESAARVSDKGQTEEREERELYRKIADSLIKNYPELNLASGTEIKGSNKWRCAKEIINNYLNPKEIANKRWARAGLLAAGLFIFSHAADLTKRAEAKEPVKIELQYEDQNRIDIKAGSGKIYKKSQKEGEKDICCVARTRTTEDQWLYHDGEWIDIGESTLETKSYSDGSTRRYVLNNVKGRKIEPANYAETDIVAQYHNHPSCIDDFRTYNYYKGIRPNPPSSGDIPSYVDFAEFYSQGGLDFEAMVADQAGIWKYSIGKKGRAMIKEIGEDEFKAKYKVCFSVAFWECFQKKGEIDMEEVNNFCARMKEALDVNLSYKILDGIKTDIEGLNELKKEFLEHQFGGGKEMEKSSLPESVKKVLRINYEQGK